MVSISTSGLDGRQFYIRCRSTSGNVGNDVSYLGDLENILVGVGIWLKVHFKLELQPLSEITVKFETYFPFQAAILDPREVVGVWILHRFVAQPYLGKVTKAFG